MKTRLLLKKIAVFLFSSALIITTSAIAGIGVSAAGITVNSTEALQNAVDSAGTNAATLTLTSNITANSSIVIGNGQNITIDLGGFTLGRSLDSAETKGSVIIVEGGSLTVKDSSQEHTGCITGGAASDFGGGISCLKKDKVSSSLTLNSVAFKNNKAMSGGAVYVDNGCTMTANGCIFDGNSAKKGGAVAAMGDVTLDGCTIKSNSAEFYGGGIYVNTKDKAVIKGKNVFSGNSSGTDGGAVYAENGKLTVSDTSFTENQAVVSGGSIVTAKTVSAELNKASFSLNKCHQNGGAILNEENFLLKESSLTDNNAEYGGGIFQNDGTVTLGGGLTKIKSNTINGDENYQNDVAFSSFSKITVTGKFERGTRIGLNLSDWQTEATTGYGKNNTVSANNYFFMDNEEYRISSDSQKKEVVIEKNPNSVRNTTKTLVEVYSGEQRISKNEYGTPADAWSKAVNATASDKETVITLGGDWVSSEMAEIGSEKHITIDLNGHYIKRDLNYDKKSKGAIYSDGGEIYLKKVTFSGNQCRDYGGAICLWDETLLEVRSCKFYDNRTEEDGGAVYVEDAPADHKAILFESCIFRGNRADRDGGAFFICDDGVALSNTEITKNSAKKRGGAAFVDSRYGITVRGLVKIKDNTCDDNKSMANLTLEVCTEIPK